METMKETSRTFVAACGGGRVGSGSRRDGAAGRLAGGCSGRLRSSSVTDCRRHSAQHPRLFREFVQATTLSEGVPASLRRVVAFEAGVLSRSFSVLRLGFSCALASVVAGQRVQLHPRPLNQERRRSRE